MRLLRRARSSPRVWVIAGTLVPAAVCTALTWVFWPPLWPLVLYFYYSIPSNSFVYLPNEPAVLWAAGLYQPWVVTVVGGVATAIACVIDYTIVRRAFEFQRVAAVRQTAFYQKCVSFFNWHPWPTIAVVAVTPLPFLPIRVLAPSSGYPLWRYTSSTTVGRMVRFYILATVGAWIPIHPLILLLIGVAVLLVPAVAAVWSARRDAAHPEVD